MIEIPNLPDKKVSLVALGEEFADIASALENWGVEVVSVLNEPLFSHYEKCHADLRIHHLGGKDIMLYKDDLDLYNAISDKGFNVIFAERSLSGKYPQCAGLNALRVGSILLCNEKSIDPALKRQAEKRNLEIIYTAQGYSRCAACVVSENAVITSDPAVFSALSGRVDVLKIEKGHIRLADTYDGMIGGASFMIDKNLLAFCGDIKAHPDFENIKNFLSKHSVNFVCLTDGMLEDVGTAVLLK